MAGTCRFCRTPLEHTFVDLGQSPLANSFLVAQGDLSKEKFYPLHVFVCKYCLLVQLEQQESAEHIFENDYAYFSSYSSSWLAHVKAYAEMAQRRFDLNSKSLVIEIASNDGYLLQYFKEKSIPVLGIEPARNVAEVAQKKGVPTLQRFFGSSLAQDLVTQGKKPDLLLGKNVLAHVPDIHDFVTGLKTLLKDDGVITFEFPHLLQLIKNNQFDTIYHEHFSYLSLMVVEKIFDFYNLSVFDVEEWPTHGGSLRIFAKHSSDASKEISPHVQRMRALEQKAGLGDLKTYLNFSDQVKTTREKIVNFFKEAKRSNKKIVGYGAPAKGNTLLNYCGLTPEDLPFTVDLSPHKQGRLLPGTHIPIENPQKIFETKPDYVLILPWNLKNEVTTQLQEIRQWGGKFVIPIPEIAII